MYWKNEGSNNKNLVTLYDLTYPADGQLCKKQYKHDCDNCVYLGSLNGADFYYCQRKSFDVSYIARYGDHGSEYISAPGCVMNNFYKEYDHISDWKLQVLVNFDILFQQRSFDHSLFAFEWLSLPILFIHMNPIFNTSIMRFCIAQYLASVDEFYGTMDELSKNICNFVKVKGYWTQEYERTF